MLHNPTTGLNKATPKMLITHSLYATAEQRGFDLGALVVGRFLHVSSVYFFTPASHSTARNFVERQA